ncbi:hypothetical protein [Acidovorax sp. RAC01]|uniref:hypothetical protein n=1 Tax=Acidovorax sp. RAC01 TaxID=1842533 RepID=UPI00083E927B|nr:hypothetical protein [Acidovorax sp. RAC01]AOG22029.1 hypothetical protein BSY15_3817 [Acidovorax sp. RAC01]AOG22561.1 hypothetical protein BSY15_3739 [Acidovorax sp. RAC01]
MDVIIKPGFTFDVLTRSKATDQIIESVRGAKNRVPREGLNEMALASLKDGASPAALFIGLWSGAHIPNGEETAATLLSLVSEVTTYSQSSRLLLDLGPVTDGACSNAASLARFDMTDSGTVNGAFITTTQAKGASTGKLYSVVRFPNPRPIDTSVYLELLAGFQFTSLSL